MKLPFFRFGLLLVLQLNSLNLAYSSNCSADLSFEKLGLHRGHWISFRVVSGVEVKTAYVFKDPEKNSGKILLIVGNEKSPREFAVSDIVIHSLKKFNGREELIRARIEGIAPGELIALTARQNPNEVRPSEEMLKKLRAKGLEYIPDVVHAFKPNVKQISYFGRFIMATDRLSSEAGFFITVIEKGKNIRNMFIPYFNVDENSIMTFQGSATTESY